MPTQKFNVPRSRTLRPVLAALGAAAACGAWADEPSPYYIGVSQGFTHDSNVYRVPNGTSDSYSSTSLLGGFDQPIGRQRVYGAANVGYNKYRDQTTLDNTSYGVNAGWDWATIEKLSGNVNASANQSLATQYGNTNRPSTNRNVLKSDQIATSVRWNADGLISLYGNYAHSRVRYSAPESFTSQSSGDTASVGTSYRLGPDLRVGAALRFTRTVTPYSIPLVAIPTGPGDYRSSTSNGRNLDLTADWRYSAQTGVNARLSYTRQSDPGTGSGDFSGLTGALSATYAPTAKLGFSASLSRDAGTNGRYFSVIGTPGNAPLTGLSENSQTSDAVSFGATYAATAKIGVNAGLQYRRAKIVDTLGFGATATNQQRNDTLRSASLGLSYAIARNWQLGCNLAHETRDVSGATGFSYSANTASCSAQYTLR